MVKCKKISGFLNNAGMDGTGDGEGRCASDRGEETGDGEKLCPAAGALKEASQPFVITQDAARSSSAIMTMINVVVIINR